MLFGASGYIAGFVAERLLADGHDLIRAHRDLGAAESNPESYQAVYLSPEEVRHAIETHRPDVVINMANFFSNLNSPVEIERFADVNCRFVTELAFGCDRAGAVLIHVGSAWQATFDDSDSSLGNAYALFKGLAVKILEWFHTSFNLPVLVLNLYDSYGPEDTRGKIVTFLTNQIAASQPLQVSGGEQILELVHVEDIASAVSRAVDLAQSNKSILNPANPYWCYPDEAVTLRRIAAVVEKAAGQNLAIEWGARPYRVGEKFESETSGKQRIPGWVPVVSLEDGISQVVAAASEGRG